MPKPKPNGFMRYCFSKRAEFERFENRKLAVNELVKLAGPGWQVLSEEQRAVFNESAKMTRNEQISITSDIRRITNIGAAYLDQPTLNQMAETLSEKNKEALERSWEFITNDELLDEYFVLIDFQHFCKVPNPNPGPCGRAWRYMPAEIALLVFNLRHGVKNEIHMLIKCSDLVHKIPVDEHFTEAVPDYEIVWNAIGGILDQATRLQHDQVLARKEWYNQHGKQDPYPPNNSPAHRGIVGLDFHAAPTLFCLAEKYEQTEGCLEWIENAISNEARRSANNRFHAPVTGAGEGVDECGKSLVLTRLCFTEDLFDALFARLDPDGVPDVLTRKESLDKQIYDYTPEIKCSFHEGEDVIHCSRLHVFKQAYGICEALSVTAGFELVEGRHKPKAPKVSALNKLQQPSLKRGQRQAGTGTLSSTGSEVGSLGSYSPPKRGRNTDTYEDEQLQLQPRVFTVNDEPAARRNWDQSTITAPDSRSTIVAEGFPRPPPPMPTHTAATANAKSSGASPVAIQSAPGAVQPVTFPSTSASSGTRPKPAPDLPIRNAVFDQLDDLRAPRSARLGVKTSDDEEDEDAFPAITRRNDYRMQPLPAGIRPFGNGAGDRDTASQVSNSSTASARHQMSSMALVGNERPLPPCNWANQQGGPNKDSSTIWPSSVAPNLMGAQSQSSCPPPTTSQATKQEPNNSSH